MLKIAFQGLEFSKFSKAQSEAQFPPRKRELLAPFYTVGYSFKTCWLLQCLKPLKKGRRGNHEHEILNRPFKPWRFSFAISRSTLTHWALYYGKSKHSLPIYYIYIYIYIYVDFLNVGIDISELDLSKTLLSSWMDVAAITRNLEHLQILNLS